MEQVGIWSIARGIPRLDDARRGAQERGQRFQKQDFVDDHTKSAYRWRVLRFFSNQLAKGWFLLNEELLPGRVGDLRSLFSVVACD